MGIDSPVYVFESGFHRCNIHAHGVRKASPRLRNHYATERFISADNLDGDGGELHVLYTLVLFLLLRRDAECLIKLSIE